MIAITGPRPIKQKRASHILDILEPKMRLRRGTGSKPIFKTEFGRIGER
jgi:hypothetical protein